MEDHQHSILPTPKRMPWNKGKGLGFAVRPSGGIAGVWSSSWLTARSPIDCQPGADAENQINKKAGMPVFEPQRASLLTGYATESP